MTTPTELPGRFDTITDEELKSYIAALAEHLNADADIETAAPLAQVIDEHCKPWHHSHFDTLAACYLKEPRIAVRFPIFKSLQRLTGQSPQLLDRMLHLYRTDHRTEDNDSDRETIKEFFQYLFATKGHQHHWDAIAETATTPSDAAMLKALQSKIRKTNTNPVEPWLPETPDKS